MTSIGSIAARRRRALVLAAMLAASVGLLVLTSNPLAPVEDGAVDLRFNLRPAAPPAEVAVVAVDDATFAELGLQWPLPRSLHARAIDRLRQAGAAQVVMDIQFTEETTPKEDFALYDALDAFGGGILATSESDENGRTRVLGGDEGLAEIDSRAAAANLPDTRDGVVRRMVHSIGRLETLAVATADRAGRPLEPAAFESEGAWIDFRGPPGTVPTVSFSELVAKRPDPEVLRSLRGKIVVVGASAPTVLDVHPTSTTGGSSLMSGPEIQANAIWTALNGLPMRTAPPWLDLLAILALSAVLPLVAARYGVLAAMGALPALGVALCGGAYAAFAAGTMLTITPALAALAVSGLSTVVASHLGESRERRRVTGLNELLDKKVRERTRELSEAHLEIISRLGHAVESRDGETGAHVERISRLTHDLALACGLDPAQAEEIGQASIMHDVGKIAVPDHILYKPGRLDDDEWAIMKTHATLGGDILAGSRVPVIQTAETIARTHHERWDGTGYPARLSGEDIPLAGRICAVCDVYDALTSERPYKAAWTVEEALEEIRDQSGRHFDPKLVGHFLALFGSTRSSADREHAEV